MAFHGWVIVKCVYVSHILNLEFVGGHFLESVSWLLYVVPQWKFRCMCLLEWWFSQNTVPYVSDLRLSSFEMFLFWHLEAILSMAVANIHTTDQVKRGEGVLDLLPSLLHLLFVEFLEWPFWPVWLDCFLLFWLTFLLFNYSCWESCPVVLCGLFLFFFSH